MGPAPLGESRGAVASVIPVAYLASETPPQRVAAASCQRSGTGTTRDRRTDGRAWIAGLFKARHGLVPMRIALGPHAASAAESTLPTTTTRMDTQDFLREVGTNPRDRTL